MKLYIIVLDEVPDNMVPVLVAHSVLSAHLKAGDILGKNSQYYPENTGITDFKEYTDWLNNSYKKVVVRVSREEFKEVAEIPFVHYGYENTVLNGETSCIIIYPRQRKFYPKVVKNAKLWSVNPLL